MISATRELLLGRSTLQNDSSSAMRTGGLLQRKCACGGTLGTEGKCEECSNKELGLQRFATGAAGPMVAPSIVQEVLNSPGQPLDADTRAFMEPRFGHSFSRIRVNSASAPQAKLTLNEPGDIFEQEADQVANQVMTAPADFAFDETSLRESQGLSATEDHTETIPRTRESSGFDFSQVRVHSGETAEQSARAVNADAYTVGDHVVFGAGQFAPGRHEGRQLIAHELTHVLQQRQSHLLLQRQPAKTPAPPAGGNILYVGMNNYKPEVNALDALYKGTPVAVTKVTVGDDEQHTTTAGGTFDLTSDVGIDAFTKTLGLDAVRTTSVTNLLKAESPSNRDDMAHVIAVYAQSETDGKDRMSRVVLSGHSIGTKIYNEDGKGTIYFKFLVELAGIFPNAAAQTKHLMVVACYSGKEVTVLDVYRKAFPNLITFSGWTSSCPTGPGAASALSEWSKTTDADPTKLAAPQPGRSNWAGGLYQGDAALDATTTMANLRADEAKFNEYFNGLKVDSDAHAGWLTTYYGQARGADLRTGDITGPDHDYAHIHAEQALRLRYWRAQVANFWKVNASTIQKGYGSAPAPEFGKMSRNDAVKAINDFLNDTARSSPERTEAVRLLNALLNLDEKELKDTWLR